MAFRRRIASDDGQKCIDDDHLCSPLRPPLSAPVSVARRSAISPPPAPSLPSTRIQISNKNHGLTQVVIVVTSVLAACLILLAFYAAARYWYSRRRRRHRAVSLAAAWGQPQPPADAEGDLLHEDLLVGGGGGVGLEEPYHVWYIRTVGLDQTVIGAITVCEYKKGEGLVEGTDCAVCLGEFGEGELLRLLPKCSHAFHIPCIDTWLRSHVNCPLCRAPVLAPAPARSLPTLPPPLPSPAVEGVNLGPEVVVAPQSTRRPTAGEDTGGVEDNFRRIASEDGSAEDGGNSAVLPPVQFGVDRPAAGASFSSEESEIWVSIDLGNGELREEIDPYAAALDKGDGDGELQPVRRSVSMDSSAMAGLLLRTRLAGSYRDGGRKPTVGEDPSTNKMGGKGKSNNYKGASLVLDSPVEMERSISGGRFFLSKFSGRARGVILSL